MKKLLVFAIILALCGTANAATDVFSFTSLTGGGSGALDAIDVTNDGIDNADKAKGCDGTWCYSYHFNSSSGAAESSPDVIKPDNDGGAAYSGNGRWILLSYKAEDLTLSDDLTVGDDATISGSLTLAAGASPTEFSTDGTMADSSDTAVPTEQAVVEYAAGLLNGFYIRPKFGYKDADEIYIYGGVWHLDGTNELIVYNAGTITFEFESTGSNAASSDFGGSGNTWHYLYLDDSTIGTGASLAAGDFLNSTTKPTWSATKNGYYNGNDRCVGAFLDAATYIIEFYHLGDRRIFWLEPAGSDNNRDVDGSWQDVADMQTPGFDDDMIDINIIGNYVSANGVLVWRKNGSTANTGHSIMRIGVNTDRNSVTTTVVCDSSSLFELKYTNGDETFSTSQSAYYLPAGM